jgi:hypothetical protein
MDVMTSDKQTVHVTTASCDRVGDCATQQGRIAFGQHCQLKFLLWYQA